MPNTELTPGATHRPAGQRPTLEMVAALAGVSRGTASRVLSGATNVSPHAVQAVRAAATELSYRPNLAARSLVTGRTGLVGLVVNEQAARLWSDPFYPQIARGAHDVLAEAGVALVLSLATDETERDRLLDFAGSRLDGVLVVRGEGDDDLVEALVASGVPCCLAGRPTPALEQRTSWVDSDNAFGARQATEHLISRGRRRIATITGPMHFAASVDRLAGWYAALEQAEVAADDSLVEHGGWDVESGERAMHALLARTTDIDAVFCHNDLMAVGAMRVLAEVGYHVPGDISIVGFDDIMAASASPALTTVRQEVLAVGGRMAELLLEQLSSSTGPQHDSLPTKLVVRESS
jgi:DNA-binding LacI/PurR family transcriptional regulator